jgi:hypothetical protein
MVLKPGAKPRAFATTEEFAVDRVAFAWRAGFAMLGPVSMRVIDSYDRTDGRLAVRALGIPLQRKRGPELAQGEAFRYLAEIPWVPQAMLANQQLGWREVDEQTVEVSVIDPSVGGTRERHGARSRTDRGLGPVTRYGARLNGGYWSVISRRAYPTTRLCQRPTPTR